MSSATTTRAARPPGQYRARLAGAMAFSLLAHALVLSLQFGIPGIGLPTLELPWRERRAQALDLDVVLADVAKVPEAETEPAKAPAADAEHTTSLPASTSLKLYSSPDALRPAPPAPAAAKKARARKSPAQPVARRQPAHTKKKTPVIALNEAREDAFAVPPPALDEGLPETAAENETPTPVVASAEPSVTDNPPQPAGEDPAALEREQAALKRAEEVQARLARETAARREQEAAAQRQAQEEEARRKEEEAVRRQAEALALQQVARQLEETRLQAEENARRQAALTLQKQVEEQLKREQEEAALRALELVAKQREETRRLEAEKTEREAVELQARKQAEEAARQKAEADAANARRRDPELVLGDAPPSGNARDTGRPADLPALPRNITGGGLAGRALDQIRRPGLQRDDAPLAQPQAGPDNPRRRSSVFGTAVKDVGLMMYVESWRIKIERNGSLNYLRSSVDKANGDPVVTVAVRSDGSVEDIVIHRSSGRPELDEAVRRITRLNARYSAFPPELARRFDVIEIRRVWNFDDRLRIMEEVR